MSGLWSALMIRRNGDIHERDVNGRPHRPALGKVEWVGYWHVTCIHCDSWYIRVERRYEATYELGRHHEGLHW